jgi:hypothetical protein
MADLKPNAPIRRFDVFAEYNRLKARQEGQSAAQAKGYGLWVAKVVAAQKFGRLPKPTGARKAELEAIAKKKKWHELGGILQTDKLFDQEIVARMGKAFYDQVFAPAIHQAFVQGQAYRDIRDSIRREWKPEQK